jgi:uncharacterized protein
MSTFSSAFLFVPTIFFIANYYLYSWFNRMLEPRGKQRLALRVGFITLLALFPLSKDLGRHDFNAFHHSLSLIASTWMGLSLYLVILALGSDLFRLLVKRWGALSLILLTHSLAFRRFLAICILGGVLGIGAYGFWEAKQIVVTRLDLPLRNLPPEYDGLSIVQLSDIHYGMLNENGRLAHIVDRVNDLHPEIVVITGDLVDEAVAHMEEMAIPLASLKAPLGVYAVMGNHEFFAGVDRVSTIMKNAGLSILRNEIKVLPGGVQILGIDDPKLLQRMGKEPPDFKGLLARLDPERPSILLLHQPIQFKEAASVGVGLQLSGHTHGAQVLPLWPVLKLFYPYTRGWYRRGESHLYVSRGVGTGGPPMRHGSRPEIVYLRLRSPASASRP